MTKELIEEARGRGCPYEVCGCDGRLIRRLADALAARQPTVDDRELRKLAEGGQAAREKLYEIGTGVGGLGVNHPELYEAHEKWVDHSAHDHADTVLALLDRLDARAAVPDAATEAERDAALAAVERVRAIHAPDSVVSDACSECSDFGTDEHPVWLGVPWPCPTVAALDGAPEPEWEYRYAEIHDDGEMYTYGPDDGGGVYESYEAAASDRVEGTDVVVRRPKRPDSPWLPVKGES